MPYITLIGGCIFVKWIREKRVKDYKKFIKQSTGIEIDTTGIDYNN